MAEPERRHKRGPRLLTSRNSVTIQGQQPPTAWRELAKSILASERWLASAARCQVALSTHKHTHTHTHTERERGERAHSWAVTFDCWGLSSWPQHPCHPSIFMTIVWPWSSTLTSTSYYPCLIRMNVLTLWYQNSTSGWWWWWLMFYGHFCAHRRLNGPNDLQRYWSEVKDETSFRYVHATSARVRLCTCRHRL